MDTDKLAIPIVEGRNELGLTACRLIVRGDIVATIYADILEWEESKRMAVLYTFEEPNNPLAIISNVDSVQAEKYFNNSGIVSATINCKYN